jgi:Caspase domain
MTDRVATRGGRNITRNAARRLLTVSLAFCTAAALLWAPQGAAETRVALIIGNSTYDRADMRLANPANDAAAMVRALKAAGFDTVVKLNAKRKDFYHAIEEFGGKIGRDPHAVGLFYYAGHAVQANGVNYLIPVDAEIEAESDLEANAFDAGRVLRAMKEAQNDMNIVILDSCRNNPLPKTRGMDRGLARMDAPSGTFIAYAAAPGQAAQDGTSGTNGVFTGELIKAMAEPGVPLEQMFKKVIIGVKADTHGGQQPWSEASIQGDFYFIPKSAGGAAVARDASPGAQTGGRHVDSANELEQSYWDRIKDSTDSADFKDYQARFPNGPHASEASLLIRKLNRSAAASGPAPAAAPTRVAAAEPAPNKSQSLVDPAAQGSWTMKIPSAQGVSTCYWDVKASGTYSSWCVGAHPGAHSGTVLIAAGKWDLNSTTTNWSDGGSYQIPNPNTFIVTGKLGTGAWLRKQ